MKKRDRSSTGNRKAEENDMARYFTREEAEALLPQISVVLRDIQRERVAMKQQEEELVALEIRARGNGHHLHEEMAKIQKELAQHIQTLRALALELDRFGCELKDPDMGLIDFLALRDGHEIYLCWHLGEERINYWHEIEAGFAGRQPL
jgi:hypothetical protein